MNKRPVDERPPLPDGPPVEDEMDDADETPQVEPALELTPAPTAKAPAPIMDPSFQLALELKAKIDARKRRG